MARPQKDEEREERIHMEIIVDCYGPEEQMAGWYAYLEDHLGFPFEAQCIEQRRISPLKKGDMVKVIGMASEDDRIRDVLVEIEWNGRTFGVPLAQLKAIKVDDYTQEALDDWDHWVQQGYQF